MLGWAVTLKLPPHHHCTFSLECHFNEQQQHPSSIIFMWTLPGLPQEGRAHKHRLQYCSLSETQTANIKERQFLKNIKSPQYGNSDQGGDQGAGASKETWMTSKKITPPLSTDFQEIIYLPLSSPASSISHNLNHTSAALSVLLWTTEFPRGLALEIWSCLWPLGALPECSNSAAVSKCTSLPLAVQPGVRAGSNYCTLPYQGNEF